MGRHAEGNVRLKGRRWEASVPNLGRPGRTYDYFDTEAPAKAWCDRQLERRARGLQPVKAFQETQASAVAVGASPSPAAQPVAVAAASPAAQPVGLPAPSEVALEWHDERYELLERGLPGTSDKVKNDMVRHVIPLLEVLLGTEIRAGRRLLIEWVRAMSGRPPRESTPWRVGRRYKRASVTGYLWILDQVLCYYRVLGYPVPDYAFGVEAMDRLDDDDRKAEFVPFEQAVRLAAHLSVIHQTVLWIIRGAGLRISEAFGLHVANFFLDDAGHGFFCVEELGGVHEVRNPDGTRTKVHGRRRLKTASSYRLVALPDSLTELVKTVITVFHTSPDGTIDMSARLIPVIRSATGGEQGFRSALTAAARALGLASANPDDYCITPHAMRKGFNTDLAWDHNIPRLIRLRMLGHKAGSDVNAMVYTLDRRLTADLRPAAESVQERITEATDTLMVPTAITPVYGKQQREAGKAATALLLELGWQVDPGIGWLTVGEAVARLGLAETTVRRLFADGTIPAIKSRKGWLARSADVDSYRKTHLDGRRLLGDVAVACKVSYDRAYKVVQHLGLNLDKDPSGTFLLEDADVAAIHAEVERLAGLAERSVPIGEAARLLVTRHLGSIHDWVKQGRLAYDHELDANGHRWITKSSLDAELARRGRPHHPTIDEVADALGTTAAAVKALVGAGHLVRTRGDRLSGSSVHDYLVRYRPELLRTPLGKRLSVATAA